MQRSQVWPILICTAMLVLGSQISAPLAQDRAQPAPQPAPQRQVRVEASQVKAVYANFSRVTGTTEEVILDFGLNTQAQGIPTTPIQLDSRVVLNFFTAKRLLAALQLTIQRHEKAFGPIEIDVRKRILKPT